ncbi:coiled-coil domain-containing protein 42 like-2-like [Sebastes umbrosus]|uniref:coiled-coil domain-containing protein 42 like-2-like n=1 Tax=Sebastes umbrosus TaxID=72105 RepID=UPI00189F7B52|nr:coiled-coil domain-containing protein 42 like-2-like [Sebastes umbrosus]
MNSKSVRQRRFAKRLPAEASGVVTGAPSNEWRTVHFNMQKQHLEQGELNAKYDERKLELESLQQRTDELNEEIEKVKVSNVSFDVYLKTQDANQAAETVERERKEVLQLEADIEMLKVESAKLMERKQEQQRQVQRQSVYQDCMEQVQKISTFDNVQSLAKHLDGLFHLRDHYVNTMGKGQDAVHEQANNLQKLQNEHEDLCVYTDTQMTELKIALKKARLQARIWDKRCQSIRKSAKRKKIKLVEIKMSTLNLYEMIDGVEAVDINDTEKQLEEIAMFIMDQKDILKRYTSSEAEQRCSRTEAVSKNNIDSKVVSHLEKKNEVAKDEEILQSQDELHVQVERQQAEKKAESRIVGEGSKYHSADTRQPVPRYSKAKSGNVKQLQDHDKLELKNEETRMSDLRQISRSSKLPPIRNVHKQPKNK